jgi:hypothetical protein
MIRERLRSMGVRDSAVVLPGDSGIPDEGALSIAPAERGWVLSTRMSWISRNAHAKGCSSTCRPGCCSTGWVPWTGFTSTPQRRQSKRGHCLPLF